MYVIKIQSVFRGYIKRVQYRKHIRTNNLFFGLTLKLLGVRFLIVKELIETEITFVKGLWYIYKVNFFHLCCTYFRGLFYQ